MELIDTHSHLDLIKHKKLERVFEDAFAVNVKKMVCIGCVEGEVSAARAVEYADLYPHVWASVGIHPHATATH
jgi:Tat protein secretion system quality control protein TatD with DNase activity